MALTMGAAAACISFEQTFGTFGTVGVGVLMMVCDLVCSRRCISLDSDGGDNPNNSSAKNNCK